MNGPTYTSRRARCVVPGCDTERHRGHLCNRHNHRLRKYGTTDDPPAVVSVRVQRDAISRCAGAEAKQDGECWEWPAHRQERGYGWLAPSLTVCKSQLAHRNAYVIAYGPLAQELSVCHRCDNPPCFRPSHLFAGRHIDNMRDMVSKGRNYSGPATLSGKSKFTPASVEEILALSQSGVPSSEIARRFDVHYCTIRRLLIGQTAYLAERAS